MNVYEKEDFYNTNKDMNNLTTMLIDLLLKRLLEERYSEFIQKVFLRANGITIIRYWSLNILDLSQ